MRPAIAFALLFSSLSMLLTVCSVATAAEQASPPAPPSSAPAWFKHKKKAKQEKAQKETQRKKEAEATKSAKDAEQPAVGKAEPAAGEPVPLINVESTPPLPENLLFRKEGFNDSFGIDYGVLDQKDLGGKALSLQYTVGWWWKPNLIAGLFGRESTILDSTYVFMLVEVGPMIRYLPTDRWMLTGLLGYGFSQGLTRVGSAHLPPPPSSNLLAARHGAYLGGQIAYLFWDGRRLAWGPTVNIAYGTQSERNLTMISLGLTFQSGRPVYRPPAFK